LGISYNSLRRWHQFGRFRAIVVREESLRFLVMPRDEIERLKDKIQAKRREENKGIGDSE
jgi:predicted site-specific integrase-resolvase